IAELVKQVRAVGSKAAARWKAVFGKRKAGTLGSCERGIPFHIAVGNARTFARAATGAPERLPGYALSLLSAARPGFADFLACGRLAGARGLTVCGIDDADQVRALGARP